MKELKVPICPECGQCDKITIYPKNHPLLITFDCCKVKIFKDSRISEK